MTLLVKSSITAMAPGTQTLLSASGGTSPYTFSVVSGTGTVNASSGLYTAPAVMNPDPSKTTETIQVKDSLGAKATVKLLVTNYIGLFCDIIQKELDLAPGRVYMWDQKIMQPTDSGLYVAVRVLNAKPFANNIKPDGSGADMDAVQSLNVLATMSMDIISRGPEARDRKEEVLMAFNSIYSQQQQEANSFYVARLPAGGQFVDLSMIDGAAIPYRFQISLNMQYFVRKIKSVPYFDDFSDAEVVAEP